MSNANTAAADRVVRVLGAVKVLLVVLIALATVVTIAIIALASSWPKWTLWLELPVGVAGATTALGVWLVFAWLQHTLAMLTELVKQGRITRHVIIGESLAEREERAATERQLNVDAARQAAIRRHEERLIERNDGQV